MFAQKPKIPADEVDDETRIEDTREMNDFKSKTFSGFKKTAVKQQFSKSLRNESSIEEACFWCVQLLSCGALMDVWDTVLSVLGKSIHIANPKLAIFVSRMYEQFREIILMKRKKIGMYAGGNELHARNHIQFRELFAQLCAVLCVSKKKQDIKYVSVGNRDFDMLTLPTLLKAPTPNYIKFESSRFPKGVWAQYDPQELSVPMNEFAYHISREARDEQNAKYWIEWLLMYIRKTEQTKSKGKKGKAQKTNIICAPRNHCLGDRETSREVVCHPIWIVWDCLCSEASRRDRQETTKYYTKTIDALLNLFGIRFQKSCISRRKPLVYMAINVLCEPVFWDSPIVAEDKKSMIQLSKQNIHSLYRQLKKDEVCRESQPQDYLMNPALLTSTFVKSKSNDANTPVKIPTKGMPPTEWEAQQLREMINERENTTDFR